LPANFGDPLLFGGFGARKLRLDFIQQDSSSQKPIESLGPLLLAFDPNAGRPMVEHNASGRFVDFLTAGARGANKLFLDVFVPNSQSLHAR
jgi:hypothetical protein